MHRRHILASMAALGITPGLAAAQTRYPRYNAQASAMLWEFFEGLQTFNVGSGRPLYIFMQPTCPFSQAFFRDHLTGAGIEGIEIRAFIFPADEYDLASYANLIVHPSQRSFSNFMQNYSRPAGRRFERDYAALSEAQKDALTKGIEAAEVITRVRHHVTSSDGLPIAFWWSGGAVAGQVGYTAATMRPVFASARAG